jgi:hypothetical protein
VGTRRAPIRAPGVLAQYDERSEQAQRSHRGEWLEGRTTIHEHFTAQFAQQRPELRHQTTLERIRPVVPDVAAVDHPYRSELP